MALFYPCGRCGTFLSGYCATVGQPLLEGWPGKSADNWLELAWGERLPLLLEKSYGFYLYSDTIHHEERCSECGRVLIYTVPDGAEGETETETETEAETETGAGTETETEAEAEAGTEAGTGKRPVLQVQLYPALR
jgi:hypothetical protein